MTDALTRYASDCQSSTYGSQAPGPGGRPVRLELSDGPSTARAGPRSALLLELYRSADTVVALVVLLAVFTLDNAEHMPRGWGDFILVRVSLKNILVLGVFAFLWQKIFFLFGLYDSRRAATRAAEVRAVVGACTLGSALTLAFPLVSKSGLFGPRYAAYVWAATIVGTLGARYLLRRLAGTSRQRERQDVIIVGSGPRALRLHRELCADSASGCRLLGFVDSSDAPLPEAVGGRMLGTLEQLESILMRSVVDQVLIALPIKSRYAEIQRALHDCERAGVQAKYLADVFQAGLARPRYDSSGGFPAIAMDVVRVDHHLAIKRMIDVVGATVALVALSPVILAVAVAVKLTSSGSVIFAQERYGLRKRRFRMLKFRTMVAGAETLQPLYEELNEASGPVFKIKGDPRLTRIGRFLRRWSLDELPQLVNVLKGDMSLVGPRPLPMRDVQHFGEAWLMRRFSVMPGLTGLWQVSGRSNLGFDDWMALDLRYIDQWSLALDIAILVRTLPAVIKGSGAT